MAHFESASSILVSDAVCRGPEYPQRHGDRVYLLSEGRHDERRGSQRGAIARSDLIDCDTAFGPPEFQRPGARLESDRELLGFRLEQYLKYLRAVSAGGLEPNALLCGLEVAESGPNAPPPDFWSLIVARDGLISQARELDAQVEARKNTAGKSLARALKYSSVWAAMVTLIVTYVPPYTGWIVATKVMAGTLPLLLPARKACQVAAAWRCKGVLQSMVERAITWELEAEGRNNLRELVGWQWVLLH